MPPVWQGMKMHLISYRRRQDASWGRTFCPASITAPDGNELSQAETLSWLGEPVDWATGDEPEFPENGNLEEYRYRCFLSAIARLDDETREILCDVFIEGLSYSECARKRGLHVTSIGKLVNRRLQDVARDAGLKVQDHQDHGPHERLRASCDGYGRRA